MEQRTKKQRMNHAEKVKKLVCRFLPPVDQGGDDANALGEFYGAIDEMQSEIDRARLAARKPASKHYVCSVGCIILAAVYFNAGNSSVACVLVVIGMISLMIDILEK